MKKLIVVMGLVVSFGVCAKDCEQEASMSAVRICELEQSEVPVKAAYNDLIKALGKNSQAIDTIAEAQAAWFVFRDLSCRYIAINTQDGGYQDDAMLNCQNEFNKARVKILNQYAKEASKN